MEKTKSPKLNYKIIHSKKPKRLFKKKKKNFGAPNNGIWSEISLEVDKVVLSLIR